MMFSFFNAACRAHVVYLFDNFDIVASGTITISMDMVIFILDERYKKSANQYILYPCEGQKQKNTINNLVSLTLLTAPPPPPMIFLLTKSKIRFALTNYCEEHSLSFSPRLCCIRM